MLALGGLAYVLFLSSHNVGGQDVSAIESGIRKGLAGQPLPPVTFYDADGKKVTLDDFKGDVVLVNLWATWCPPCVMELPALDKLQAKLKGRHFKVVAISMDRTSIDNVTSFLEQKKLDHLTAYWDKDRAIPSAWKYDGLPTSYLVGADGTVVQRFDGPYDWAEGKMFDLISAMTSNQ